MRKNYCITLPGFFILVMLGYTANNDPTEKPEEAKEKTTLAISNNNQDGFYFLGHLGTMQQPGSSKVCWAVCLANIAQGIVGNRNLTVCDLIANEREECAITENNTLLFNGDLDSRRDDEEIISDARYLGMELIEFDKDHFKDFEYMKKIFKEENVPIIVKFQNSEQAHLVYISGYGKYEGCTFYYVFDPLYGKEKFRYVKDFWSDVENKFLKAWKPKPINNTGTILSIQKSIVNDHIAYIEKQLDSIYDSEKDNRIVEDYNLKNPLRYLSANDIPLEILQKEQLDEKEVLRYLRSCSGNVPATGAGPTNIYINKIGLPILITNTCI
jgi:hypothetical protein